MIKKILAACVCVMLLAGPVLADKNLEKAQAYFSDGNFKKAVKYSKKVLKKDPNNVDASICLADSYTERGDSKKAIEIYRDLIKRSPEDMKLVFRLGQVYNKGEYHRDAALAYEQILMKEPENLSARYWLGVSYALSMDLTKAYTEYRILKGKDEKLANELLEYIQTNR
jgi:Flp pilus assembly protein TadD